MRLTTERTTVIILFMMLFALATRIPLDTDTWWHLRTGQHMVETREIIAGDPFSYTRLGEVRPPAEWITQILMYGIWQAAGDTGLALYTATLATLGMAFLFRASEGNVYLRAFIMILAAAASAVFWSARPQMVTFFFSAVLMFWLMRYKRQAVDYLAWTPLLLALWANMHPGYFIGLLMLYGTLAGELLNRWMPQILQRFFKIALVPDHPIPSNRLPKLAIVTVASTAAVLLNPVGFRLLQLPFETFTLTALRQYIQEWNPPDLLQPSVLPFTALLLLTAGVVLIRWRRADWTELALLAGSGYLAVTVARNISFFAVVATPILSYHLHALFVARGWVLKPVRTPSRQMVHLNQLIIAVVLIACVAKVALVLTPAAVDAAKRDVFPVAAVEYLNQTQPADPMFNSYNWGGYLMFHAPQYPVYIDGRTDLYAEKVLEYADIAFAREGWENGLEGVRLVVIEAESPLAHQLSQAANWTTAYQDALAAVFVLSE